MRIASSVLVLTLICLPTATPGQGGPAASENSDPRVIWLRDYAVELENIDPAAPGFDDLAPLEAALSGARVVLLGDATRWDGSTFLARGRLIRFLHREMGFDVLALECSFYACGRAWRQIQAGEDAGRALERALLPPLDRSEQFRPVVEFVAENRLSDRPLIVAGTQSQLAGDGSPEVLLSELRQVLGTLGVDPEKIPGFGDAEEMVRHLARESYAMGWEPMPPQSVRQRFAATLERIRERLAMSSMAVEEGDAGAEIGESDAPADPGDRPDGPVPSDDDLAFWRQVVDNLDAQARLAWEMGVYRRGEEVSQEVTNISNRQRADNILWLAERRYPGSKIVVWSTTIHMARDLHRLDTGRDRETRTRLERFVTVGDVLDEALGDAAYLVGFTAYRGRTGSSRGAYPLLEPTPGSFEELMARTGLEAAFVDLRGLANEGFRGRWLNDPLIARPISFKELRGSWPRHLDALVFLHTLEPSRRIEEVHHPSG